MQAQNLIVTNIEVLNRALESIIEEIITRTNSHYENGELIKLHSYRATVDELKKSLSRQLEVLKETENTLATYSQELL